MFDFEQETMNNENFHCVMETRAFKTSH